jgi:anthranilate synthase/aminodeoxychorismate synthase-like glutamine amidotransferase
MILLIDNYDSFTFNLYHYIAEIGEKDILVKRNDQITISEIKNLKPKAIILSPGPCTPNEAGICLEIIKEFAGIIPIFGVCLGHQAIGQAMGGKIIKTKPMHGKISQVFHTKSDIFHQIPSPFKATRYHSLIIDRETCPKNLTITAETEDKIIMAIADEKLKLFGVQFHPESIASEFGHQIIKNFLEIANQK